MIKLSPLGWLRRKITDWLTRERPPKAVPLCDFQKVSYEIRPCDVLLIEGRSRVSDIIRMVTQSPWSHAGLYIGRLHDINDPKMKAKILQAYPNLTNEQLVVESLLGHGTIVVPLTKYQKDHIRICRPKGILPQDAEQVIHHAISKIGAEYDVRQIVDLFRFLLPVSIMPRRWRSTLFIRHPSQATREICSSMIAEAFAKVKFPVLPLLQRHKTKGMELIPRNPRLFTPRDFDYSPYFEIIKYPIFEVAAGPIYRSLPWNEEGLISHDVGIGPGEELFPQELTAQIEPDEPSKARSDTASAEAEKSAETLNDTAIDQEKNPPR